MTPKERIKAYEATIKDVLDNPECPYMCPPLRSFCTGNVFDSFPEFKLFKPLRDTYVWFNTQYEPEKTDGNNARLNILLFCIEMAKDAKQ